MPIVGMLSYLYMPPNATPNSPAPPPPTPPNSETPFHLGKQLLHYCLGMLGIALLGLVLGFVFPWTFGVVDRATGFLGYLGVIPIWLFEAGFWGIVTYILFRFSKGTNLSLWIYGVVGLGLGMFLGLNAYELPLDSTDISYSLQRAVPLALGWAVVHALVYGCQQVAAGWQTYRRLHGQFSRRHLIFCCCAATLLLVVVMGVLAVTRTEKENHSVHLPNSSSLIAKRDIEQSAQHPSSQVYTIYYRQQSKKPVPYGDTLTIQRQANALDGVTQSCKTAHITMQNSASKQYTYAHLNDGFMYGEATFPTMSRTTLANGDTTVTDSRSMYCFVIDGFTYTLGQSSTSDKNITSEVAFAKGPSMIQAIREAPAYRNGCGFYIPVQGDLSSHYCNYSEVQRYNTFQDDATAAVQNLAQ